MSRQLQKYIPFVCVLVALLLEATGTVCSLNRYCLLFSFANQIIFSVLSPLRIYALCALIPSIAVMFIPRKVFASWLRFASWWIPLSLVAVAITPDGAGGWIYDPVTRDNAAWLFGILFAVIGTLLIGFNLSKEFRKIS